MIGPDPRPAPGLARWAESYEAKSERRQETRESRRCRPNVTTCRLAGKAPRTQQREQLRRARQQQFFRRRNLEVEEKGEAQSPPAREPGPSRRTGQATDLKEPLSWANRISSPRQQVSGTSSEVFATQHHPPSGAWRDPAGHHPTQASGLPPQASPIKKAPKHHRGTQTKAGETQSTIKNDASQQTNYGVAVLDKEIIQLSEYLKEALQRELILKQKMVILQDLLSTLIQASDSTWKGQLNEDKLKGKLRSLENQLYACTQKYSPWGMKKVLLEMEDQKNSYEQKAKESLQKVLEEKMSAEQQLQSTQRSLALAEQKCEQWKSQYEALKEDWKTLGTQHRELESQLHVLQSKLQTPSLLLYNLPSFLPPWDLPAASTLASADLPVCPSSSHQGADSRDSQMNQALRLLESEHQELQARIECLQEDRDLCSSDTQHLQDQALPVRSPKPSHNEVEPEGPGKEQDLDFRDELQKKTLQLLAKEKECRELHSELDNLSDEYLSCLRKLQHCREELSQSQKPPPRRQCGQWLLMLMALIAIAVAVMLANKDSLML
ncbi:TRAF3-interacting JNK-activating modulator isoform X4 [Ovis aries]|uniref:TRAF3-interacting JNK-activating modulator isoform X4 n=1 Tax=Ovis aries TaxID=9940 RepID=UPI0005FBC3D9|nr:TRAF3-interacting JNK-activating modulator isoform X4 [Ovis aries]